MEKSNEAMQEVAACIGRIVTDERTEALVLIPTNVDRFLMRACSVEALTQVMGPVNDSDEIKPSISNDPSGDPSG
ncbi:MAG: DUF2927 domain-containing protein [Rhodospirillales bacterium]|nr:DUF2927 domain-containing protein [Rhodospirillales bacterium]